VFPSRASLPDLALQRGEQKVAMLRTELGDGSHPLLSHCLGPGHRGPILQPPLPGQGHLKVGKLGTGLRHRT
jgi:hypothetical protein